MQNLDLGQARNVAILLPATPSYDTVAAALALKLSLDQAGKPATVVSSEPMTVEFHRLVGVETVANNVGSRNLVITFPGQTEAVDKVSYNIENGVLQLVITPKAEVAGLDYKKLQFFAGVQADFVIQINSAQIDDSLVDLPRYNLEGAMLCQNITRLIQQHNLPLPADAASNLLSGIERATNNFQDPNTSAETFEVAAILLRQGARRQTNLANAADFPEGSIPNTPPPSDWTEPKIYRGTTLS